MECTYWKRKEVEAHFGVTRETIRRWRKTRGFPEPIHFGGHERGPTYFVIEEVLAWEARCRAERKDERPRTPPEYEGDRPGGHPV